MSAFEERKAAAVTKAEKLVAASRERLEKALQEYDAEVAIHERRGDGFFSTTYLRARKEAVLAQKALDSRLSALSTARAELAAATLSVDWADA